MKIYSAAVFSNNYMKGQDRYVKLTDIERDILHKLPNILESYHYVGKQKYVDNMRENKAQIFLDSGAFSAYTLGVTIDISVYCDYIKRNMDLWKEEDNVVMYSVLDGIGDPLQTYRNQLNMEALGVRPLPCFHAGEDERYLEYYIQNYEYITLGGMVGASSKQLCIWLDRIWDRYPVDGAGKPKVKVHGFGITSIPIMSRYPWWSVDSSSWIQTAAFGGIMTKWGNINISDKNPSRHDAGQHATTLTAIEQDMLFELIERQGFTYERLSTVYESRAAYNLWAYVMINETMNAVNNYDTFQAAIQELF